MPYYDCVRAHEESVPVRTRACAYVPTCTCTMCARAYTLVTTIVATTAVLLVAVMAVMPLHACMRTCVMMPCARARVRSCVHSHGNRS